MKRRLTLCVIALICAGSFAACSSQKTEENAAAESTASSIDPVLESYTVSTNKNEFTIQLPANATTGYSWVEGDVDTECVKLLSEYKEFENSDGAVGVGGTETFKGTLVQARSTSFTLTYKQDWDGGETAQTLTVTITAADDGTIEDITLE